MANQTFSQHPSSSMSPSRPQVPPYSYTMQQPAQESQPTTIEMSLREHLLAAGAGQTATPITPTHQAHAQSPHEHHNIDPAIAGPGGPYQMGAGDSGGDGHTSEGRKGRRELSTSKRAAQNRAAQRAFRQRKEEYIKSLKDQVKEYETLAESYKAIQAENFQLRDYIINLQSRLLELQCELPPPPANIDLSRPHPHGNPGVAPTQQQPTAAAAAQPQQAPQPPHQSSLPQQMQAPTATMSPASVSQLQVAAAQASAQQLGDLNHGNKHHEEAQYMPASDYQVKRSKLDQTSHVGGN